MQLECVIWRYIIINYKSGKWRHNFIKLCRILCLPLFQVKFVGWIFKIIQTSTKHIIVILKRPLTFIEIVFKLIVSDTFLGKRKNKFCVVRNEIKTLSSKKNMRRKGAKSWNAGSESECDKRIEISLWKFLAKLKLSTK